MRRSRLARSQKASGRGSAEVDILDFGYNEALQSSGEILPDGSSRWLRVGRKRNLFNPLSQRFLQKKKKEKKKKESSKQRWRRLFDTFSKKMRPRVRLNCLIMESEAEISTYLNELDVRKP